MVGRALWIMLVAILAMAGLDGGPAGAAGKRVALVIGNAAYPNAPLVNAVNDADAMEALFKKAGFDAVIAGKDLDRASMSRILDAFQDEARGADIAVVFYSGHGIEVSGMNYLVPVDARLTTDREVKYQAIPLDDVLASLDSVAKLRLVLLDACRYNPFLTGMKRVATKGAFTRGLARAEPVVSNTLIGYATGPGRVAFDGEGGLSPFTAALVEHLTEPGVEVEFALRRVRDDVIRSTRDMARRQNREPQEPYRTGSIGSEPIMLGAVGEGAATGPSATTVTPSIAPVPSYDADAAALGRAGWDEYALNALVASARNPEIRSEVSRRLGVILSERRGLEEAGFDRERLLIFIARVCEACIARSAALDRLRSLPATAVAAVAPPPDPVPDPVPPVYTPPATTYTPPPAPDRRTCTIGGFTTVVDRWLALRSTPYADPTLGNLVERLQEDSRVRLIETSGDWNRIESDTGQIGWAAARFMRCEQGTSTASAGSTAGSAGRLTTSSANYHYVSGFTTIEDRWLALRSSPYADPTLANVVEKLVENTKLKVLESRGDWYRVEVLRGRTGWVSSRFVRCCRTEYQ